MREYNNKRKTQRKNESPVQMKARLEKENFREKCSKKDQSIIQRKQRLSFKQKENVGNLQHTNMCKP